MFKRGRFFLSLAIGMFAGSYPVCYDHISSIGCNEKIAVVDLDDVVSIKGDASYCDYFSLPIPWTSVPSMVWNYQEIKKKGKEIARTTEGTSNIVAAVLTWLEEEKGYQGLHELQDPIVQIVSKAKPIQGVIDGLREMKKNGVKVVGATNQDYETHLAWRKDMVQHGIDVDSLFDGVLTTRGASLSDKNTKLGQSIYPRPGNVFELVDKNLKKPDPNYFLILQQAVIPKVTKNSDAITTFTDDKAENVEAACSVGIDAFRFPLPPDSSSKKTEYKKAGDATSLELGSTVKQFKEEFRKRGYPIS
jgi:hypothetical protein